MTSYGYLPLITQPTRFSEDNQSLIDNIFTNSFSNETLSGNILIEFADHLTQFASVNNHVHTTKNEIQYKLDKSNFDEKSFLEDLSIQNFDVTGNPNDRFSDLLWKYEDTVKRHIPVKKMSNKEKN